MKLEIEQPAHLVDISRLPLNRIEDTPEGGLRIGSQVRNSDLAGDPRVRSRYAVLSQALLSGASGQLRNKDIDRRQSAAAYSLPLLLRSQFAMQ